MTAERDRGIVLCEDQRSSFFTHGQPTTTAAVTAAAEAMAAENAACLPAAPAAPCPPSNIPVYGPGGAYDYCGRNAFYDQERSPVPRGVFMDFTHQYTGCGKNGHHLDRGMSCFGTEQSHCCHHHHRCHHDKRNHCHQKSIEACGGHGERLTVIHRFRVCPHSPRSGANALEARRRRDAERFSQPNRPCERLCLRRHLLRFLTDILEAQATWCCSIYCVFWGLLSQLRPISSIFPAESAKGVNGVNEVCESSAGVVRTALASVAGDPAPSAVWVAVSTEVPATSAGVGSGIGEVIGSSAFPAAAVSAKMIAGAPAAGG